MKHYEFMEMTIKQISQLDELGKDGWFIVSTHESEVGLRVILQRRLVECSDRYAGETDWWWEPE